MYSKNVDLNNNKQYWVWWNFIQKEIILIHNLAN